MKLVPHDVSIKFEEVFEEDQHFKEALNRRMLELVDFTANLKHSSFNPDNFLSNPTKTLLFSQNQGTSLSLWKNSRKLDTFKEELEDSVLRLILFGQKHNLILNDLRPKNITIEIPTELETKKSRDFSTTSFGTKLSSTKMESNDETMEIPYQIRVFKESDTISQKFINTSTLASSANSKIDFKTEKPNSEEMIKLRVLNTSFGKVKKFDLFNFKIEEIIRMFLEFVQKEGTRVDVSCVESKVCIQTELEDLLVKEELMKESVHFNSIRTINFEFDYEADLGKYSTGIPGLKQHSAYSFLTQGESSPKEESSLKIPTKSSRRKKRSFWNLFETIFSGTNLTKTLALDHIQIKNCFNLSLKKVQNTPCPSILKFGSIFGFLKVESGFIGEAEKLLYSILDIFNLYPLEVPFVKKTSLLKVQETFFGKKREDSSSKEIIFKDEKIVSFFSDAQMKVLLYILTLVKPEDFERNKLGVMIIFGFYNDKELSIRNLEVPGAPGTEAVSKSGVDAKLKVDHLTALEILLDDITRFQKKKVFQFLGLDPLEMKHFVIKLGLELSPQFASFSDTLKTLYFSVKNYMFQYLIYLMFSKKIDFFHKFLIIAALKSKNN